jgi:ribonucleoside-diphosphate reductase alpha subunit
MKTSDIDDFCSTFCADKMNSNLEYEILAKRILVSNMHKNRKGMTFAHIYREGISTDLLDYIKNNAEAIEDIIDYDLDFCLTYFGLRTLRNGYLREYELPQDLWMRVALAIHYPDFEKVKESYQLFSTLTVTHATPTLFNAGTTYPQLASCFLSTIGTDSVEGIYDCVKECALISKYAGGIGLSVTTVRNRGDRIVGTNGVSDGIVPMLKVFESTAKYINQGGKRKGSFAIYIEPWHKDIEEWVQLKRNDGVEDLRCRDLFYGLWVNDLFMRRVEANGYWTLFSPTEVPGLVDLYGDEFDKVYEEYEAETHKGKRIQARNLWLEILETQATTGMPYMCYKDHVNKKSNQKNIGTIRNSNLCTEIMQFSGTNIVTGLREVAVCNLASISLKTFSCPKTKTFNFKHLQYVTEVLVENLNKIIDINYYPVPASQESNLRHRPIGIGVQGLANCFFELDICFESEAAHELNRKIFQTIYFAAVNKSVDLARIHGPYSSYDGSPTSAGLLQFDLWGTTPDNFPGDWTDLKQKMKRYGIRNSLLCAPMPTASTAQILGNYEAFEPVSSNMYTRRVLSGEFHVVNKYLVQKLVDLNLWSEKIKNEIIANEGSIQAIANIPQHVKELFKTAYEITPRTLIEMAAERGPFIDQSQSLNIFLNKPTSKVLSAVHFLGWKLGLKTGLYYLRSKGAAMAQKISLSPAEECTACSA